MTICRLTLSLACSILLLVSLGCSPSLETARTLSNEGILPLSSENAYLGSNLFLAREAERSQFLFNFLKGRGGPSAIRVKEDYTDAPRIDLFYAQEKEMYIAELDDQRGQSASGYRQWIVRGPYAMSRIDYREVVRLASNHAEPLFMIYGKPYRFGRQRPEQVDVQIVIPPPPVPTPKPKVIRKPKSTESATAAVTLTPKIPAVYTPLNFDQQALLISQGYAERSQSGDVVHVVKSTDETIAAIAKWYTGDALQATAILAANSGLETPEQLKVGDRVTVPMGLVKQFKAMPGK